MTAAAVTQAPTRTTRTVPPTPTRRMSGAVAWVPGLAVPAGRRRCTATAARYKIVRATRQSAHARRQGRHTGQAWRLCGHSAAACEARHVTSVHA
jgi:hypothetical protein